MHITHDRVLVTGGSGFIGSHTVDALLKAGLNTWILDDLSTGSRVNLTQHKRNPKLHFIDGSICNYKIVDKLTSKVDAIVHLAAIVSPLISIRRPELTNYVNVVGTLNILKAASKHNVQRVVFASSSSVYGDNPQRGRIDEKTQTNPTTPYGASKLAGEKYCRAFYSTYGLSSTSLRYFNIYGERQRDNPYSGVIAIFTNRLLSNQRGVIFGDGEQTRDFVHVTDVARANLLALTYSNRGAAEFNIGTGIPTSINELYILIAETINARSRNPIRRPARPGDIRDSCANINRSRALLGFTARTRLRDGLTRLLTSSNARVTRMPRSVS